MRHKLVKYKYYDYDAPAGERNKTIIKELVYFPFIREDYYQICNYAKENGYTDPKQSFTAYDKKHGEEDPRYNMSYVIEKYHGDLEYSEANKMLLRNKWNKTNPVYALCVACGKPLTEGNKKNHTECKYGIIGPECIKKLSVIGLLTA